MPDEKDLITEEKEEKKTNETDEQPETAEHPVPGIKHEPEPDAENMMPVEDGPGTF
jgi:hypothetical protein